MRFIEARFAALCLEYIGNKLAFAGERVGHQATVLSLIQQDTRLAGIRADKKPQDRFVVLWSFSLLGAATIASPLARGASYGGRGDRSSMGR